MKYINPKGPKFVLAMLIFIASVVPLAIMCICTLGLVNFSELVDDLDTALGRWVRK